MRGTVIKRGKTWSVIVDLGLDADGKRIRKWHSGFSTKSLAEKERTRLLSALDNALYVGPEKLTLARFTIGEWLPAMKATVRATTWESYRINLETYLQSSSLGAQQLQKVTPAAINAFYADLLDHGRKDGKPMSPKSVRNIHGILHKAFRDAVRWGRLSRNVADLVDPPRWARPEMSVWTAEQLRLFLTEVPMTAFSPGG